MKRKALLISLAVALVAMMALGVTLAYFTDTKEATNTFVSGNVKITLDEAFVGEDGMKVVGEGAKRVTVNSYPSFVPGSVYDKDPTVHNTGKNSAFVRVKITIPEELYQAIITYNTNNPTAMINPETDVFKGYEESAWALWAGMKVNGVLTGTLSADGKSRTFIYYYTGILAAGTDTAPVFTQIAMPSVFDKEISALGELESFNIVVVAEAVQVDKLAADPTVFVASEMYAAFDATFDK